jgi:predicted  nucleic acid-binding Zn-ribbon protein
MTHCVRCGHPFKPGDRIIVDPCCGAPDCDRLADESHYECLPVALQRLEDE